MDCVGCAAGGDGGGIHGGGPRGEPPAVTCQTGERAVGGDRQPSEPRPAAVGREAVCD